MMRDLLRRRPCLIISIFISILVLFVGACTPSASPSFWEPIIILAETEQSHAPALWVQNNIRIAAWIGADEAGVHHDARLLINNALGETVTLPLPPQQPYSQHLLPAANEKYHLLWLDTHHNDELRLFTALLNPDLSIARGPVTVSDHKTHRFTVMGLGDGRALTLWSGGSPAEPGIFMQIISARGIPQAPQPLLTNADWPTLLQANDGTRHLVWLDTESQQLQYGVLADEMIHSGISITNGVNFTTGLRLHALHLALDFTHIYIFWNMTRSTGPDESWYVSRALGGGAWAAPQRLGVSQPLENFIETGLNTGPVPAVSSGDNWLTWAAPLRGQFDVVPIAVSQGEELGIVYLQGSRPIGYQPVKPLRQPLIGPPLLQTDRNRYLYLAWAEPTDTGRAQLKLADTRP